MAEDRKTFAGSSSCYWNSKVSYKFRGKSIFSYFGSQVLNQNKTIKFELKTISISVIDLALKCWNVSSHTSICKSHKFMTLIKHI